MASTGSASSFRGCPNEALPKLEALLPTLPEKAIDQLLDYVAQLQELDCD